LRILLASMPLLLNSFPVEVAPLQLKLPYLDYPSWADSTTARDAHYPNCSTWRYELDEKESEGNPNRYRMIFLRGPQIPTGAGSTSFDLGRFWRIGCLTIEDSLSAQFVNRGYAVERTRFERVALARPHVSSDGAVELATGLSFSARRPFREEPYRFAVSFQWIVRACFKDNLENDALARIATGMPVLYKPSRRTAPELAHFQNRFLGRIRSVDRSNQSAVVMCKDDAPRSVKLRDLRLEASPAVIKAYETLRRPRPGPSPTIRTIQQLKMTLTNENRRNITALRDRLDKIRSVLVDLGSSRDQLVVPLVSYQSGSISMGLAPEEAQVGESW
jgi:hypothetical protein